MIRGVVITGLGMVTPLGNTVEENWDNITNAKSGIGPLTRFNPAEYKANHDFPKIAGEVKDFNPEKWGIDFKIAKKMDRFCQYALAAAKDAISDSGINLQNENPYRIGVLIGSGLGGGEAWGEQSRILLNPLKGAERVSAFFIPMLLANIASAQISIILKSKGVNFGINSACASGCHSIGEAFDKIRFGRLDIAVAGGTEACIVPQAFAGFNNMRALSRFSGDPKKASRPFDKNRDGFIMAEGAGVLVLENLSHAIRRNAQIYGEVLGYGATSDAGHITNPSVEGPVEAMRMALDDGAISLAEVDYINAHGTSTSIGDANETKAIRFLFGPFSKYLMVSSTKSMTGHLLGASGAVETIYTVLALKNGIIPPTINYEESDPECNLDYVPNQAREVKIKIALSNSFGFGGTNACLALGSGKSY